MKTTTDNSLIGTYFFSTGFGSNLGSHAGTINEAAKIAARIARMGYGPISIYDGIGDVVRTVTS